MKKLKNYKKIGGYKKTNVIIIAISLAMILCMSVGYSALQKILDIKTSVTLRADIDIRINSLRTSNLENGANEIYNSKYTEKTITTNVELPNLNSSATYEGTIKNDGNKPMKVKKIEESVYNNENVNYTITGVKVGDIIEPETTTTFTITFAYKSNVNMVPTNKTIGSVFEFEFEEYVDNPTLSYETNGLVLNLEGINPPVNNSWVDDEYSHEASLTNVTHNALESYYDFGTNGYANLGEVIIPRNDNFTLEVLLRTPTTISNIEDQAIITQVNDGSNDSGRFKFNIKAESGTTPTLQIFVNQTSTNTPGNFVFANPSPDTTYLLQVVRTSDTLELYLNGNHVRSVEFPSNNNISQTNFKIGRWNNSSNQQFKGKIYAVRVYNRALSAENMANNYNVDQIIYTTKDRNIREYAVETGTVTSGNGLYADGDGYRYRGTTVHNYLKFPGDNDVYRIINFESNGTMKILNTSRDYNIPFDASGNRDPDTSKYCTNAATHPSGETVDFYGCNYFNTTSSVVGGSDDNVSEYASIKEFINTTFYNSLSNDIKEKIVTHSFPCGRVGASISFATMVQQMNSDSWSGKIGLLTAKDVYFALESPPATITETVTGKSYISNLTTSATLLWTINASTTNTWDVIAVGRTNTIGRRRASRITQPNGTSKLYYYAYPAFYIRSDYFFTGSGTEADPYILKD